MPRAEFSFFDKVAESYYQQRSAQGNSNAYLSLGQLYESKQDLPKALKNYLQSAILANNEAQIALERVAKTGNIIASYHLGILFEYRQEWNKALEKYTQVANEKNSAAMYRIAKLYQSDRITKTVVIIPKNIHESLKWYKQAAIAGSAHALADLIEQSALDAQAAIIVAQLYEISAFENKQEKILEYYLKAYGLNDKDAAFRLGQYYETEEQGNIKNLQTASRYYIKAAENKHIQALVAVEKILNTVDDKLLEYELAELYQNHIKNSEAALVWYKKSAEKSHSTALYRICQFAYFNAEYAYVAAGLHEAGVGIIKNLPQAVNYYGMAACKEHVAAKNKLESLARANDLDAQYTWGYVYYYQHKKDISESVKWCLKAAEKNHTQSLHYITKTVFSADIYYEIGQMYEKGEDILSNINHALEFYVKASDIGHKEATFRLGELYSSDMLGVAKDLQKSCRFYLKAMQQSHPSALAAAEQILNVIKDPQLEYELGNIHENFLKDIITALNWYKKSADQNHSLTLTHLSRLANLDPKNAYHIGQIYENNTQQALNYYLIAARNQYPDALRRLEQLATENVDAQYALGYEYYLQHKKNILEALRWCIRAAEKNHIDAFNYINNTVFSGDIYFSIAQIYEQGPVVNQNQAFVFYKKASDVGHKDASFRLGQLYESGEFDSIDLQIACKYYLKAAENKHPQAIIILEQILEKLEDKALYYELAEFYQNINKNSVTAVKWYKKSVEKGYVTALSRLCQLADSEGIFAYTLAGLYEIGNSVPLNMPHALNYYSKAACKNHSEGLTRLEQLAVMGDSDAQYILANEYYRYKNNILEMVKWCMKAAEKQHAQAIYYLNQTVFTLDIYLKIAKMYQQGEWISQNNTQALVFYQKASDLGDKEAALQVAELYSVVQDTTPEVTQKIWKNYIQAAKMGSKEAIVALERLARQGSSEMHIELAEIYRLPIFNDQEKTKQWLQEAINLGNARAQSMLETLHLLPSVPNNTQHTYVTARHVLGQNRMLSVTSLDGLKKEYPNQPLEHLHQNLFGVFK